MTKIDIFSGFLGAGKTTLIKKLLKEAYAGEQVVLIENEFGEIGIDGGFLSDAGINITEMNSGCICCSLVGDFTKALAQVLEKYSPDRILIEPSGVGKLSDVVRAVSSVLSENVVLNCLCAVADANKCKMYAKNFGEFYIDQIKNATSVILSHTGGISDKKNADAVALLRENNENATIVTTPWELLDGKAILETMEHKDTLDAAVAALKKEHHAHHHDHDEECKCGHHHHDHDEECECGHHHHDHDEECECGHHHHHDHDEECECGHHHHDHDEECECGHHHHHDHDEECECGHHHHHDHDKKCGCGHDHHHHHADEVFQSWGRETTKKYTKDALLAILETFSEDPSYGMVLRAKGIVPAEDGTWLHFDYVPGEPDVRVGGASVIGRLCVIGAGIDENKLDSLFGLN